MGYNIHVGEAKPVFSTEYCELYARWRVNRIERPDAPCFPNDEMTGCSNSRYPSYSGWSDFCKEAGLYELFFCKEYGLIRSHPGCEMIQEHHLSKVKKALNNRIEVSCKDPGFTGVGKFSKKEQKWIPSPDKGRYDSILARLIWLDYWMTFAMENFEIPAIENS